MHIRRDEHDLKRWESCQVCQLFKFHSRMGPDSTYTSGYTFCICLDNGTFSRNRKYKESSTVFWFDSHIYCHSSFILPAHPSFSTAHLHTETSSRNISSCMAHGVARLPLCWWTVCLADFPLTGLKKCGSLEAKKAMATEWEKLNLGRHEERAQIQSCWCCL